MHVRMHYGNVLDKLLTPTSVHLKIGVGQRALKVLCFRERFWFRSGRCS
jgi:hypothetical protein